MSSSITPPIIAASLWAAITTWTREGAGVSIAAGVARTPEQYPINKMSSSAPGKMLARNLVLLPVKRGYPLPGFLQNDPHCIEQIDGNAQPACGCKSGDWNVQDSLQLKK